MWVFLNNAMLSIVAHKDDPDALHVRARVSGDIQAVFPYAEVLETPNGDYRFRADIDRMDVEAAISAALFDIRYTNFKNSVPDRERHDVYFKVWQVMYDWQHRLTQKMKQKKPG